MSAGLVLAAGAGRRFGGPKQLARISAPIGLDLGALTADETALSIMAEIVALKHGHSGGRLAHARGRIHEVGV